MRTLQVPNLSVGDLGSIRPTVNFANYITAPAGYVWGPRTIPDYQLVYIVEGGATFEYSGQKLQLAPGNCIFLWPAYGASFGCVYGETAYFIERSFQLGLRIDGTRVSDSPYRKLF